LPGNATSNDGSIRCIAVSIRRNAWTSKRNLVSGEDQSKVLLLAFAFEFSEGELVER